MHQVFHTALWLHCALPSSFSISRCGSHVGVKKWLSGRRHLTQSVGRSACPYPACCPSVHPSVRHFCSAKAIAIIAAARAAASAATNNTISGSSCFCNPPDFIIWVSPAWQKADRCSPQPVREKEKLSAISRISSMCDVCCFAALIGTLSDSVLAKFLITGAEPNDAIGF